MNDIAAVTPQLLAQALLSLRNFNVLPMLVNTDYSTMFAEKGDTVDIPTPGAVAVQDVAPSNTPPVTADDNSTKTQVPLDQWKEAPFYMDDKDMQSVMDGYFPRKASYAIASLINEVNDHVARTSAIGLFTSPKSTNVGSWKTTPFGTANDISDATKVRAQLNRQMAPMMDRSAVLDPTASANALTQRPFNDISWAATPSAIMEGDIQKKFGIRWYEDQQVAGNNSPGAVAVNDSSKLAAGISTATIDGAGAGNVRVGDFFMFASGDTDVKVVTAVNSATSIDFFPALSGEVADDVVLTFGGGAANLVFQRDAIAFVNRPLMDVEGMGNVIQTAQDPVTGLTIRLEVSREHKRTRWSFDMLYGCRVIRPELGVVLLG